MFGKLDIEVDGPYEFRLVAKDLDEDGAPDPRPEIVTTLPEMPLQFMVTSKDYWESAGEEEARLHPIGAGPYQFKEHVPGVSLTYEKFSDHYRQVPEIDEVVILVIDEFNTRLDALTTGTGDLMVGDFEQIGAAADAGLKMTTLTNNRNPAIYLPWYQTPTGAALTDPPPWDSNVFGESGLLVRKALSKLIDRDEIVEYLLADETRRWRRSGDPREP